jgi:hypothetical protein
MNSSIHTTSVAYARAISEATAGSKVFFLIEGGEPAEILPIAAMAKALRELSPVEAGKLLREVAYLEDDHLCCVMAITDELYDWDELFLQPGMVEIDEGEVPELIDGDSNLRG